MDVAVTTMLGVSDQAGQTLVRAGALLASASLTRVQVNTRATALGADGAAWQEHPADTPRFPGPAGRLLIEGQRVNAVRNPRCEGAVAGILGSGGALPANWAQNRVPELALTVVGAVTVAGLPGLRVRISGTTAAGGGWALIEFENAANVVAAPNQSWAGSVFWRIAEGSLPAGTLTRVFLSGRTSSSTLVAGNDFSASAPLTATLSRAVVAATLTGDATLARVSHRAVWNFPVSTPVDVTVDLCVPQLEQGTFVSTPILPPIGARTASTRGGDIVTAAPASLGIGGNGACTLLWSGLLSFLPPSGGPNFDLCNLDDGGTANRIVAYVNNGSASLFFGRVAAGASSVLSLGAIAGGTPFRFGLSHDGAGRVACSLNGGAPLNVTGAPTGGYTTLRLGSAPFGGAPIFGETATFRVLPYALPDAALPGAVAALPG